MEIEKSPDEILNKQLEIIMSTNDKDTIRSAFVAIHAAIKSRIEFFNPRGPYHELVIKIIECLNKFFTNNENNFEFYKGLIFLSNMCLYLDRSYSEQFLMTNPCLLNQLSKFFLQQCDRTEKTEQDYMNEHSLLALLAQLLHQTNRSEIEEIQEIRESIMQKQFIQKILDYEIEDMKDPKRMSEVSKIMSLMLIFIVKRKKQLQYFKLLPKAKTFILKQIYYNTDYKILCNFFSCLHYIAEVPNQVRFTEKELLKYNIIEKIDMCLQQTEQVNLIFYSSRMLKIFIKFVRIKQKIIKLNLFEKIIKVFSLNPRGVSQFIEEFISLQSQNENIPFILESEQFFDEFIFQNLRNQFIKKEELKYVLKILIRTLQFYKVQNIMRLIQQKFLENVWQHFEKSEQRIKELILELFKVILKSTEFVTVDGKINVVMQHLECFNFYKILQRFKEQLQPFKMHKICQEILMEFYQFPETKIIL